LKQFCSAQGKEPLEYEYIPRFFDAGMDKIGQIRKDIKMALLSNQNAFANRMTVRGWHFGLIAAPF
jgi:hypothetical protein